MKASPDLGIVCNFQSVGTDKRAGRELSREISNIIQAFQREITNIQHTIAGVSNEVKEVNREIAYIKECRNRCNPSSLTVSDI